MRRARAPFTSRSRADAVSRAQVRADWVALLRVADLAGRRFAGEGQIPRQQADELAHRVARHAGAGFPLAHASAADAAGGFRLLAKGFVTAARSELKAPLGEAMAAAARCCLRMLEQEDAAAAAAFARQTARRLGEREED